MTLAPFVPHRRQDVDSPLSSPGATSPFLSTSSFSAASPFQPSFSPSSAQFEDSLDFDLDGTDAFYSSAFPPPLHFSSYNPHSDNYTGSDSRQPTTYDQSTFTGVDASWVTDGSLSTNPQLLLQQSTFGDVSEAYTPPPMHTGSYQAQTWSNNNNQSVAPTNWTHLSATHPQHHRNVAFRSHKRLSSGSSAASAGPDSPYTTTSDYPHIVDTDSAPAHSPNPAEAYETLYTTAEQFAKPLLAHAGPLEGSLFSPAYSVQQPTDHVAQYLAAQSAAIRSGNQRPGQQRRHNMIRRESSLADGVISTELKRGIPSLNRNASEAQQDELYNPPSQTSQVQQPQPQSNKSTQLLSPTYRPPNAFTERLQAANAAREASPATSSMTGERSPFRDPMGYDSGDLDFSQDPNSSAGRIHSVAQVRAQQKMRSDAEAYAQHHQPISRQDLEAPKTISPMDAYPGYSDAADDESKSIGLFNQQHTGALFNERSGGRSSLGQYTSPQSSQDTSNLSSMTGQQQQQQYHFNSTNARRQNSRTHTPMTDQTPEFPATLSSMESTKSESYGPETVRPAGFSSVSQPSSSQEESSSGSPPQRPADTSAHSGSYTCMSPSCAARFSSSANLQKHRRVVHRATSPLAVTSPSSTTSAAASTSQPAESATPPVSRNSNNNSSSSNNGNSAGNNAGGPHRCTQINPSTGKPCNTNFSRSYDLTRHEETIHTSRKHKVRCQLCTEAKTFSRNDALTRHMRVVHPEVEFSGKTSRRGRV